MIDKNYHSNNKESYTLTVSFVVSLPNKADAIISIFLFFRLVRMTRWIAAAAVESNISETNTLGSNANRNKMLLGKNSPVAGTQ
jgi:hypothetical protein